MKELTLLEIYCIIGEDRFFGDLYKWKRYGGSNIGNYDGYYPVSFQDAYMKFGGQFHLWLSLQIAHKVDIPF